MIPTNKQGNLVQYGPASEEPASHHGFVALSLQLLGGISMRSAGSLRFEGIRPMTLPRRRIGLFTIICLAAALQSGCALFAPRYDAELDSQAATSYLGVARLLAGVELGEFASPGSYVEARSRYADVVAALAAAEQHARSLPVASRGTAPRARAALASLIADCRAQVVSLAGIHRRVGLRPDMGVTSAVNTSCDAAARGARAMR